MEVENENKDKAGKNHWDKTTKNSLILLKAFCPEEGIRGFGKRLWESLFDSIFKELGNNCKLLELGCGGSAFLPYFAKKFGFRVSGIDYSQNGCDLAKRICEFNNVDADIVCCDFFKAPDDFYNKFDVVVSFGVIEHFTDTSATLEQFSSFLKPGGRMLTVVPNMMGLTGFWQKILSKEVYLMHEIIDCSMLKDAHEKAGLTVLESKFFIFNNFGVINPGNNIKILNNIFFSALKLFTLCCWILESCFGPFPPNKYFAPYVVCVSKK